MVRLNRFGLALLALAVGCSQPPGPAAQPPAPPLVGLPTEWDVAQRTSTPFPVEGLGLELTIDDVTRGQVMVHVNRSFGTPVLGPTSLRPGEHRTLEASGHRLQLTLVSLHNALMGMDRARFRLEDAGTSPTDAEKIERLIVFVEQLRDRTFVRNGTHHSSSEAAAHLRRKAASGPTGSLTARTFIESVASRSSLSGAAYLLIDRNGVSRSVREVLLEELARIESAEGY